jgi:general secretion pathway protein I
MNCAGCNRPGRRTDRARGFTLIEVLVALVIVALGMMGAIQAVIQVANAGTYLRERTLAHWIAMNLITERRLQTAPPDIGTSSDLIEFAGQRWRWRVDVSETAVETMRRFDVRAGFADAPEDPPLARATGFYGTAIAPSGTSTVVWDGSPGSGGDQDGDGNPDPNPPDGDGT